jgi:hypothetical protein
MEERDEAVSELALALEHIVREPLARESDRDPR